MGWSSSGPGTDTALNHDKLVLAAGRRELVLILDPGDGPGPGTDHTDEGMVLVLGMGTDHTDEGMVLVLGMGTDHRGPGHGLVPDVGRSSTSPLPPTPGMARGLVFNVDDHRHGPGRLT